MHSSRLVLNTTMTYFYVCVLESDTMYERNLHSGYLFVQMRLMSLSDTFLNGKIIRSLGTKEVQWCNIAN